MGRTGGEEGEEEVKVKESRLKLKIRRIAKVNEMRAPMGRWIEEIELGGGRRLFRLMEDGKEGEKRREKVKEWSMDDILESWRSWGRGRDRVIKKKSSESVGSDGLRVSEVDCGSVIENEDGGGVSWG